MSNKTLAILAVSLFVSACNQKTATTDELESVLENGYADSVIAYQELEEEILYRYADSAQQTPESITYRDSIPVFGDTLSWRIVEVKVERHEDLGEFSLDTLKKYSEKMQKGIYFRDNRRDWFEFTNAAQRRAAMQSVCLIPKNKLVKRADGKFEIRGRKFIEAKGLCTAERFKDQIVAGFCSGFPVNATTIVTAGHCVKGNSDLTTFYFVLNYRQEDNITAKTVFEAAEVYNGVNVISRQDDDATQMDYAVVTVDHPIPAEHIASIRITDVALGEPVVVAGYPCGLPVKYADEAKVFHAGNPNMFLADLDTYGGNSGSPVFDANNQVVGILVQGAKDFHMHRREECRYSNVCSTYGTLDCEGEGISRVSQFLQFIAPNVAGPSEN